MGNITTLPLIKVTKLAILQDNIKLKKTTYMLTFDKLKVIFNVDDITDINEDMFVATTQGDCLLYYKYSQKKPFSLIVMKNFKQNEATVEFTGKILLDDYVYLINKDNIEACFNRINDMGICRLNVNNILATGHVVKCDVTKDIKLESDYFAFTKQIGQSLKNYSQWSCKRYRTGLIIENNAKTARHKKRICIYSKQKELQTASNLDFMNLLNNKESLLSNFQDKVRFELNINAMAQIRNLLQINDNRLMSVLHSTANPILHVVDEALQDYVPIKTSKSLRDYERELLIKECNYDIQLVEAKIRTLIAKSTSVQRIMQPYRELCQNYTDRANVGVDIRQLLSSTR